MQFFGCGDPFSLKRAVVCCPALLLLLGACSQSVSNNPVQVCEAVTKSLLGFELPEKVAVSQQEIQGERIVVHLNFKRPVDSHLVKSVCVYGIDLYRQPEKGLLYNQVPTRLAINGQQVTESDLLAAISGSGLKE